MGETVELPRWIVLGAGSLLLGSIFSTAFLLGRSSAPAATVMVPSPASEASSVAPPAPPQTEAAQSEVNASGAASPSRTAVSPDPAPAVTTSAAAARSEASSFAGKDDPNAVTAYFQRLDQIGGMDPAGIDPNVLVQQAMRGDVSGLDQLISDHKQRQRAISQLRPPKSCAQHHTKLTRLAADGLQVMEDLRSGIVTGNVQSLMGLQPAAMRLQSLGSEVSQLEAQLRGQYDIP